MVRKALSVVALAVVLTCGPTAVAPSSAPSATASRAPIVSTDLISLREGGQQGSIAVRRVATSELVATNQDGLLLPDGKTLLLVEPGAVQTTVKRLTRLSGALVASTQIPGTWQLHRGWPWYTGASPDGSHVAVLGSSYNFSDASGVWTARTTFGVLDVATWRLDPIELVGRYSFEALSNDGRFLYLAEYTPSASRSRVYDVTTRTLGDVAGDAIFFPLTYVGSAAYGVFTTTEAATIKPDVIQVTGVTKLARLELDSRKVSLLSLPLVRATSGEDAFIWSVVPSRDGSTLYVLNPTAAVIHEVDVASLTIRRTASLKAGSSGTVLDGLLALLHPTAQAKEFFMTGAVLSPDGAKLYVLGLQSVWSVELSTLKASVLTSTGSYMTIAISPDGARLYVIGREDGIVSALDARTGKVLGSMERLAFPSDIVAVDAG